VAQFIKLPDDLGSLRRVAVTAIAAYDALEGRKTLSGRKLTGTVIVLRTGEEFGTPVTAEAIDKAIARPGKIVLVE
jgi:hypothetical protein